MSFTLSLKYLGYYYCSSGDQDDHSIGSVLPQKMLDPQSSSVFLVLLRVIDMRTLAILLCDTPQREMLGMQVPDHEGT